MSLQNRKRMEIERTVMRRELPQFSFYEDDECYFQGWQATNDYEYDLKLVLPRGYPYEMPLAYVISPHTLETYDGETINDMGCTHSFHTLSNGPDGCVQICHTKPTLWDPSDTAFGVFIKMILWVNAYDWHLITGKDIADILEIWSERQG